MDRRKVYRLTLAAMFLALGLTLPFLTGQIPQIGNMLLPMHIPVFFCGLLCGKGYGATVGATTPLLRSLLFSKPALFPSAIAMSVELAAYGFLVALFYSLFKKKDLVALYVSLVGAMLGGRLLWGITKAALLGFSNERFPFSVFLAEGFTAAILGIVIQLVLIPAVMLALKKTEMPKKKEKSRV